MTCTCCGDGDGVKIFARLIARTGDPEERWEDTLCSYCDYMLFVVAATIADGVRW